MTALKNLAEMIEHARAELADANAELNRHGSLIYDMCLCQRSWPCQLYATWLGRANDWRTKLAGYERRLAAVTEPTAELQEVQR